MGEEDQSSPLSGLWLNQRSVCRVHKEAVFISKAFLSGTPLPAEQGCAGLLGRSHCRAVLSSRVLLLLYHSVEES